VPIEGQVLNCQVNNSPVFDLFLNSAFFMLHEYGAASDPIMFPLQLGAKLKNRNESFYIKGAATYYKNKNIANTDAAIPGTLNFAGLNVTQNTRDANDVLTNDYNALAGDLELGFNHISKTLPSLIFYGQFVRSEMSHDNIGALGGIKLGHMDVKKSGQWLLSYNYRSLERDCWLDFLGDYYANNGLTNSAGSQFELQVGLAKKVVSRVTYNDHDFKDYPVRGTNADQSKSTLQVDLIVEF
jgi:hypothetical protein